MILTLYRDLSNVGVLSFVSKTRTITLAVPERAGFPPSTAVSVKLWTACCSRSNFSSLFNIKCFFVLCRMCRKQWKYDNKLPKVTE
uniref:Uncharacterized protein n=1 Tax=Oryzias latipes TaxID=8090 RepID=A0A3P9IJV2_ORYLA